MKTRQTLLIIAALTIITAISQLLSLTELLPETGPLKIAVRVIGLAVILLIIQNGTLFHSKVFSVFLTLCLLIIFVGAIWKIMHWPYANLILMLGFGCTAFMYTIRFLLKNNKEGLDYIKWGYVILTAAALSFKIFHWSPANTVVQVQNVFFLALLLAFLRKIMLERRQLTS